MANVAAILGRKGNQVVTISPHDSVATLVRVLSRNRIGAAPVIDRAGRLVGIISERDVIHGLAQFGDAAIALPVERLMTEEVRTCTPEDAIVELMETMTHRRIRHLPVLCEGELAGIVSIGDVVKQWLGEAQSELDELRSYIRSAG